MFATAHLGRSLARAAFLAEIHTGGPMAPAEGVVLHLASLARWGEAGDLLDRIHAKIEAPCHGVGLRQAFARGIIGPHTIGRSLARAAVLAMVDAAGGRPISTVVAATWSHAVHGEWSDAANAADAVIACYLDAP